MHTPFGRSLSFALMLAVGCSSSSSSTGPTPAHDGGTSKTDGGTTKADSGTTRKDSGAVACDDGSTGLKTTFTTTCAPSVDASAATQLMPPIVVAQEFCLTAPLPSGITVLDSAAALTALFNADAGSGCAPPSLPTGVDFTTDSLAVFTGAGFDAQSLTVYQLGTQILLQVSAETFGAIPGSQVYIVVLPTAEAKSAEVISCTTSCSGACPG